MYNLICMRTEVYGIIGGKMNIDLYCRFLKSIIFIAPVSDIYFLAGIHAGIQRKVEKSESHCYISTAWMKKKFWLKVLVFSEPVT